MSLTPGRGRLERWECRRGGGGESGCPQTTPSGPQAPPHPLYLPPHPNPQEKPLKRPSEEEAKGKALPSATGGGPTVGAPPSEAPSDLGGADLEPPSIFISVTEDEESSREAASPPDATLDTPTAPPKVCSHPPSILCAPSGGGGGGHL